MDEPRTVRRSAGVGAVEGKPWIGASAYWMPRHIVESAWLEHAPFGFWIVDALRPRIIVELGTHNGFSYFVFCEAIARLGLSGTRSFALDSWLGDDQAGFYGDEVYQSVAAINTTEYAEFSTLLKGYFDDSLEFIEDGSVDLLHIDGRHGYDDVRHDFTAWLPKLSARGVVVLHDIAEHTEGFGVWQFWAEVSGRYPSFAFDHEHGLGIIAVGPEMPEAMRAFLEAAGRDPEAVKTAYQTIGEVVSRQYQLELAPKESERLRGELAQANQQLEAQRQRLEAQNHEIGLQRADLEGLRNLVDEMRASSSWRVTGPLRAASDLLHGRKP
ncbi:MAG: class I SAM-dependent methyltransferase [Microbacteriaceae bacterium]